MFENAIQKMAKENQSFYGSILLTDDIAGWEPEMVAAGSMIMAALEKQVKTRREQLKKYGMPLVEKFFNKEEGKSMIWEVLGGRIKKQASTKQKLNEERIRMLCVERGIFDRVFPRIPTFDVAEFERCVNDGTLSSLEKIACTDTETTYSYIPELPKNLLLK